ncbi:hypothetical protein RCL1_005745 [Eukaryota sp. TZLM3-RCL]
MLLEQLTCCYEDHPTATKVESLFESIKSAESQGLTLTGFSLTGGSSSPLFHKQLQPHDFLPICVFFCNHYHNLTFLDLSYNKLSDISLITKVVSKTNLEKLVLKSNTFTSFTSLFQQLSRSNLTHLDISFNTITSEDGIILAGTLNSTKLRELYLSNCFVSSPVLFDLISAAKTSFLTHLDVSDNYCNPFPSQLASCLSEYLVANIQLKFLNISGLGVTDFEFNNYLYYGLLQSKISSINLSKSFLTEHTAEFIGLLLKSNEYLGEIFLDNCRLGDQGFVNLSTGLVTNSTLSTLSLRNNQCKSRGLLALSNTLRGNSALEYVYLAGNIFDDEVCRYWCLLLQLKPFVLDVGFIDDGGNAYVYNK